MIIEIHKSDDGHTWRYIDIVSKAVLYTIRIEKACQQISTKRRASCRLRAGTELKWAIPRIGS